MVTTIGKLSYDFQRSTVNFIESKSFRYYFDTWTTLFFIFEPENEVSQTSDTRNRKTVRTKRIRLVSIVWRVHRTRTTIRVYNGVNYSEICLLYTTSVLTNDGKSNVLKTTIKTLVERPNRNRIKFIGKRLPIVRVYTFREIKMCCTFLVRLRGIYIYIRKMIIFLSNRLFSKYIPCSCSAKTSGKKKIAFFATRKCGIGANVLKGKKKILYEFESNPQHTTIGTDARFKYIMNRGDNVLFDWRRREV